MLMVCSSVVWAEDWWNSSWTWRIPVQLDSGMYERKGEVVALKLDMTELLKEPIDPNSFRLIKKEANREVPFELRSDQTRATIIWRVDLPSLTEEVYDLYFDSVKNGPKAKPDYAAILKAGETLPDENLLANGDFEEEDPAGRFQRPIAYAIGGFESDTNQDGLADGWERYGKAEAYTLNTDKAYVKESLCSQKIAAQSNAVAGIQATFPVEPGAYYTLSGWVYPTTGSVSLVADGNLGVVTLRESARRWYKMVLIGKPEKDQTQVCYHFQSGKNGTFYVDNVQIAQGIPGGKPAKWNLLRTISGEQGLVCQEDYAFWDEKERRQGKRSLRLAGYARGAAMGCLSEPFPVKGGAKYVLTVWLKIKEKDPSGVAMASLFFLNQKKERVAKFWDYVVRANSKFTCDWRKYVGNGVAPTDACWAVVSCDLHDISGTACFDDVSVEEIRAAPIQVHAGKPQQRVVSFWRKLFGNR